MRGCVGRWLFVCACLVALPAAAGPPNGKSTLTISGAGQVFVPQSDIQMHRPADTPAGTLEMDGEFVVTPDIAGMFATNSFDIINAGTLTLGGVATGSIPMDVTGKTSGRVGAPRVRLTAAFAGPINVLGVAGSAKGSIQFFCAPDEHGGSPTMPCVGHIHFCGGAPGVGHTCGGGSFESSIAAPGGDWTLSLALETDASNRVTGGAKVVLGDDATAGSFNVSGNYNPKTDTSNLKFTGLNEAAKARLSLTRFAADGSAGILKFKLDGQTGTVDLSKLPMTP